MQYAWYLLLTLLFSSISQTAWTQAGCTDPQATNYNSNASENDGSCTYPATSYQLSSLAQLPQALYENSGLAYIDGAVWTHVDSDGANALYQIDASSGTLLKTVFIQNAANTDWEDLAYDGDYIYIGDFGNNKGMRTDLSIYRIGKEVLVNALDQANLVAELIMFSYSEQTNFDNQEEVTPYDCEAFFAANDSLHLFTKNWGERKTAHYIIPSEPGIYEVTAIEELNAEFLITAADISPNGKEALLLGYNLSLSDPNTYMWLLSDFEGSRFFSGNKRKISLGSLLSSGQLEAVAYTDDNAGYIASEFFNQPPFSIPARVFSFDTEAWRSVSTQIVGGEGTYSVSFYPNPTTKNLYVKVQRVSKYQLFNLIGQEVKAGELNMGIENRIAIEELKRGMYLLRVSDTSASQTFRVVLK